MKAVGARQTHNGSTERVEGVGAAGVEVSAVQPLQEPHVVEALGLRRGRESVTPTERGSSPLHSAPTHRLYLVVLALLQAVHLLLWRGFPVDLKGEEGLSMCDSVLPSLQAPALPGALGDAKILSPI